MYTDVELNVLDSLAVPSVRGVLDEWVFRSENEAVESLWIRLFHGTLDH